MADHSILGTKGWSRYVLVENKGDTKSTWRNCLILDYKKNLDANKILSDSQYGFRPGMSTVHAAAERVEQISSAIDGQRCSAGVFIDLKKAFDTVDHELLVEKLNVCDIRSVSNKWLQNDLTNRKQYVVI